MTAQMQNVFSTSVSQIGHDPDTNELFVQWQSGKTSVYQNVPADIAQQVMNAPSVGTALQAVKANYPHRYHQGDDSGE